MKKRTKLIAIGIGGAGLVLSSTGIFAQDGAGRRPQRHGDRPTLEDMDTDGDGNISLEEFTTPQSERIAYAFDRLDSDGDGLLSREELESRRRDRPPGQRQGQGHGPQDRPDRPDQPDRPERPERPAFQFPDMDGDGSVSLEEFTTKQKERAAQRFEHLDRDGDGLLSKEEMRPGRRGPRPGAPGGPPPRDGQDQPPE